jgi:hypothetical protein
MLIVCGLNVGLYLLYYFIKKFVEVCRVCSGCCGSQPGDCQGTAKVRSSITVLGSGIRCFYDPWIRDGKKSESGSGIRG